jgi:chromosome segregation ATPase
MKLLLLVLVATCSVVGCDARTEVAKGKLLAKIDSMLGEMDVKRKEIELSVNAFKEGTDGLRKAKIKAQVKQDQIKRQAAPLEEKRKSVDTTLAKLRDHLASGKSADIGGKTYSPEELKTMADKVIQARKELVGRLDGYQKSQASLQKVVDLLERKLNDYQQRLSRLESQIAEIDSKAIALKAMKDASAAMGESEKTLATNIDNLEAKVNDLYADMDAELLGEDEKWNEMETTKEIDAVDAFIDATQEPTDTLSEIDKILAGEK